eukprot:1182103-Pleurochrysis_carterae.AAC.2
MAVAPKSFWRVLGAACSEESGRRAFAFVAATFADAGLSESLDDWRSARAERELAAAKFIGTTAKPDGAKAKPSSATTPRSAVCAPRHSCFGWMSTACQPAPASTIPNGESGASSGSFKDRRYGNLQGTKAPVALTPLAVPRPTRTASQSWALAATLASSPMASPTSSSTPSSARAHSRRASSSQGAPLAHPFTDRPRVPSSAREARNATGSHSSSRRKH